MHKLLNSYLALPSFITALKIKAYAHKHPMAATVLSKAEADLLALAIAHAKRGPQFIFEHVGGA